MNINYHPFFFLYFPLGKTYLLQVYLNIYHILVILWFYVLHLIFSPCEMYFAIPYEVDL